MTNIIILEKLMNKYRIVSLFIPLLLILPINIITSVTNNHSPIHIIGNDEFTHENGVTGGSGTENDPYIIENLSIDGNGLLGSGIHIENTTAYFVIRNCSITNFYSPSDYLKGILFNNVENGRIENTITSRNHIGIRIEDSKLINLYSIISSGRKTSNAWGISLRDCDNISIQESECYDKERGLSIYSCSDITVKRSSFHDNLEYGVYIGEQNHDTMRIQIENCCIYSNDYDGIWINGEDLHPSYSVIKDCEIYNNGWGFIGYGIDIDRFSNNVIENCSIYNHSDDTNLFCTGLNLGGWISLGQLCQDNLILYCDIYNNEIGILLVSTFRIRLERNKIFNNSDSGVDLEIFAYGKIQYNNFENNGFENSTYNTMCIASQQSFIDFRYNWWNDADGPTKYLALGWPWAVVQIPIKRTDGESVVFWKSIALTRPWLTEPVPDACRQT